MGCRISASWHRPPNYLETAPRFQMKAAGRPKSLFLSGPR